MIAAAIACIVIGLVFLFLIPWVGIIVGLVGLALAILSVAGIGRAATRESRAEHKRV